MGFFDKRNRLFRQKIHDLQRDLEQAEREGNYTVAEGVYFARMADMSDSTQLVMVDELHADEEVDVIRAFLERNGFSVEELRISPLRREIQRAVVIPPNEIIVSMAMILRNDGYRIIDETETPQPFDYMRRICPIGDLAHAVSLLFARKVQRIISNSSIKMTKEGNRLLSWMPLLVRALGSQVPKEVIDAIDIYFDEAFEHFYSQASARQSGKKTKLDLRMDQVGSASMDETFSVDCLFSPPPAVAAHAAPAHQALHKPQPEPEVPVSLGASATEIPLDSTAETHRLVEALNALLAGAEDEPLQSRRSRVVELLLERLGAQSLCLIARTETGDARILAQAGRKLHLARGEGGPVAIPAIRTCLKSRSTVVQVTEDGASPSDAVAARAIVAIPVVVKGRSAGILYLERSAANPFQEVDLMQLELAANALARDPRFLQAS
jgi:hypothetical protein